MTGSASEFTEDAGRCISIAVALIKREEFEEGGLGIAPGTRLADDGKRFQAVDVAVGKFKEQRGELEGGDGLEVGLRRRVADLC